MRKLFREQSVLLISVFKWVVLSTGVGIVVGASTALFLNILEWSSVRASGYSYYYVLLPLALFLSAFLTKYLAPDAEGHGTEKVIEAVHKNFGRIRARVVPVKLFATVVTLALGGSAGKEGPCAQIGAGMASGVADILRFNDIDRKKLVICGISSGFAAVFGTPIAGAIFGVEVLVVGSLLYDVLLPSFIAGITSYEVAAYLGVSYPHIPSNFTMVFSESFFLKTMLSGVFFGLCSVLLIIMLKFGKTVSEKIKVWLPLKGIIGGVLLLALAFAFSPQYLGLGLDTVHGALGGQQTVWYAFILKALCTSITLNFGGSGGIVTPIFFIGASSGTWYAQFMGLDTATFAAIGLVALLAGAANTPIAASIMAVELFGPTIAPYAAVACVISFLMTGYRSVYPSQLLSIQKSAAMHVELGKEIEHANPEIRPIPDGLVDKSLKIVDKSIDLVDRHVNKRMDQSVKMSERIMNFFKTMFK